MEGFRTLTQGIEKSGPCIHRTIVDSLNLVVTASRIYSNLVNNIYMRRVLVRTTITKLGSFANIPAAHKPARSHLAALQMVPVQKLYFIPLLSQHADSVAFLKKTAILSSNPFTEHRCGTEMDTKMILSLGTVGDL